MYKAVATITFEGMNGPETITKELIFILVPSIYAMALYAASLIIIITALLLIGGSKRKVKLAIKESDEYIVKAGETLNSIAKDHNVKWKLLAKVNGRKPPYDVKEGDTLLIPLIKGGSKKEKAPLMAENNIPINENTQTLYTQENAVTPANPIQPVVEKPETPNMNNPIPTDTSPNVQQSPEDIVKAIQSDKPTSEV